MDRRAHILRLDLLGPIRVRGETEIEIERPAQRRLLSILAMEAGQRVSTEVLIDRFWPDGPPDTARAAIQTHVSALRRQLGDGLLATEGYGYRLNVSDHSLDVDEFTRLAGEANRRRGDGEWQEALESIGIAMGMWRGEPFEELADDEFARAEITRLTELHLGLLELRAEALIVLGREEKALPDLEALVVNHPYRERLWEHLMTARYRLGRHADALRAFQELSEHLAEIGVEPGEPLRRLEEKILVHDQSLTRTKHNLPVELDSFIGREKELAEAAKLLADNRLVTLTGAGGSGKTRLATHLAQQLLDQYPDGIWYIELADLRDPSLIASELVGAIGLSPAEDALGLLGRALSDDTALIIIDNCEHLIEGASKVARSLLESATQVRVIATSREPLRVPGEAVFEVPSMALPAEDASSRSVLDYDAVRLFSDRAQLARNSFVFDEETQGSIVDICRRLDGMPLAIELAAARTASMAPGVIADRLDDRFDLLTRGVKTGPSRHETLEAVVDWSYQLLNDEEQAVLLQLSVFTGGFEVEMAEHVCVQDAALHIVSDLVSKSLVSQYDSPIGRRYRLLETIWDFALLRLDESGQLAEARDRHLDWCLEFASGTRAQNFNAHRESSSERLEIEADNLLSALDWAEESNNRGAVGVLSEALERHWWALGRIAQAVEAMETALAASEDKPDEVYRLARLAEMGFFTNDPASFEQAKIAYRLGRELEPGLERVYATSQLSERYQLEVSQDPDRGLELARETEEVAAALDDPFLEILALRVVANALTWNGDTKAGITKAELALGVARDTGVPSWIVECQEWLLHVLYMDPVARRDGPRQVVERLLADFPDDDPRWSEQLARGWVPWVLIQTGQFERAERNLNRLDERHLGGWRLVDQRNERASVYWMQGRLDEAKQDVLDAEREGIHPRLYHDYYPLRVDVLADLGELEEARKSAEIYLNADVHSTEQNKKVGVLNPLVRAMVDRALRRPELRDELLEQAQEDIDSIERIITQYPQPIGGSISIETPLTHLAFARAELSRATGPDPELWREAANRADFLYFRLYARLRLAEALLETGETEEGRKTLQAARLEAQRIGAQGLVRLSETITSNQP